MASRRVTVFGGTGFLGRRVVRHLLPHGYAVRVASRHPERAETMFGRGDAGLEAIRADVTDDDSVAAAVADSFGVVNAVSLYVERGRQTFHSVHVEAAARVASHARRAGVERLAHVSGVGSDPSSSSPYIRSRGQGELAVRTAFSAATFIRPAVMFGDEDAFVTPIAKLLRRLPVFGMFGRGRTKLQPAFVDDVAEAIARSLATPQADRTYELGGARVYSYEALLRLVARQVGARTLLVPVPFALWRASAYVGELLPSPPITRNQVELMQVDNVAAADAPGFGSLGILPQRLEDVLPQILGKS